MSTSAIKKPVPPFSEHVRYWPLDRSVVFLNHGSFGASPIPVLEHQRELLDLLERNPMAYMIDHLERLIDESRNALGSFLNTQPESLVFVRNATEGVNAVVRSLRLEAGDELLTSRHEYNACNNALDFVAERAGAKVVGVEIGLPVPSDDEIVQSFLDAVTERTKLVMLSWVTSNSAAIFPIPRLVQAFEEKGIPVLVDAAHAPGMISVDLNTLNASFVAGNCHKWICAPKGAAFLSVREDWRDQIFPTVVSHGLNTPRQGRSRYHDLFDWMGTDGYTAALSIGKAIEFMRTRVSGGWDGVRSQNHELACRAGDMLTQRFQAVPTCENERRGSLAGCILPTIKGKDTARALQATLRLNHKIEVPIMPWSEEGIVLRISAQLYNAFEQYEYLADVLEQILKDGVDLSMAEKKKL
ncbi:MAG: aminotransferase class V-fold PLP-dependent enzyme [Planctomycetota bacterium]